MTRSSLPPTAVPGRTVAIFGATRKFTVLVEDRLPSVTVTGPVTAPSGTCTFSDVAVGGAIGATGTTAA